MPSCHLLKRFPALLVLALCLTSASAQGQRSTLLDTGWKLESACRTPADGAHISASAFPTTGWLDVSVPSTVLAAEVAAGRFRSIFAGPRDDPYYGMNLRRIPGTNYPIGTFYANQEIPADSPYACGWWYRRALHVTTLPGHRTWLHFAGINYTAEIWINGQRIATRDQVAGAYRTYDLDITEAVAHHPVSVLAIQTFAPGAKDLGINWVDWNPCPADKDMGLWGEVRMEDRGPVSVRSPFVRTHFTDDTLRQAELTMTAEVENATERPISAIVDFVIDEGAHSLPIHQAIQLAAHEHRTVTIRPAEHPELRIAQPEVWWPVGMGAHPLHRLRVTAKADGILSDAADIRFGIREMSSELDSAGHRLFRVNRKPILIRGAGWSPDMLLRPSPDRMRQQFALVNDMHLNTIRLEGKLETDAFFDLADEQGILVMAGWCCCDHWEHWKDWTPRDAEIAAASLRSQMLRLRHHSSLLVWLNGSDGPPPEKIERMYLAIEEETGWPNATLSSASATPTVPTGASGVKMLGPYDYVVPSYWLRDTGHAGGAYGFNTETSPGPDIPSVRELKRFLPEQHLWPPDDVWAYHTGGGKYKNLAVMQSAMENIYGAPTDLDSYVRIAGAMAYDSERAMFESYGRRKYTATGVVQWMLNNAWPSLIWHLYDYNLQPGAGYYGTKKALEPVHIQYSYDDRTVAVVNSLSTGQNGLTGRAQLFDLNLKPVFAQEASVDVAPDGVQTVFTLPVAAFKSTSVSFLSLELRDRAGAVVSRNFYWLPANQTEFDWPKTDYTHTPPVSYEDLRGLRRLPPASLSVTAIPSRQREDISILVTNTSPSIAFQIFIEGTRTDGSPFDTLLWEDNYLSLLPGESRTLTATALGRHSASEPLAIHVSGWNTPETSVSASLRADRQR